MPTQEATHEAWTLMAAFAAATSRVELGQMCTCMGYRNPAYLAKVAATVDVISGGRTRWASARAGTSTSGAPTATASRRGERLGMLDEGVQIMRQLWATAATLDGKHYQVDGAICRPLPLQDGGIPLWIAGGGEHKTLRIAAQYAQYTNFDGDPEASRRKSEILAAALPRGRHRLRRDRAIRELQRRDRRDREGRAGPARLDPRAPRQVPPGRERRAHLSASPAAPWSAPPSRSRRGSPR